MVVGDIWPLAGGTAALMEDRRWLRVPMTIPDEVLKDRFRGCLLGLAIGDALGGKFEAQSGAAIRGRFPTTQALIDYPQEEIWYTDDTQMAIGVAEALVGHAEIIE